MCVEGKVVRGETRVRVSAPAPTICTPKTTAYQGRNEENESARRHIGMIKGPRRFSKETDWMKGTIDVNCQVKSLQIKI